MYPFLRFAVAATFASFAACSAFPGPGEPQALCGGFQGLPCEGDLVCVDDPSDDCDPQNGGADCSGICVAPDDSPQTCGGMIGGACPDGQQCIDDPSDNCDPEYVTDCGGICEPTPACGEDADCREGEFCDLAAVLCEVGVECGTCKPFPTTYFCEGIDNLPCAEGEECVDDPSDDCAPQFATHCARVCQPTPQPEFCGGIAGFPCPDGLECFDNPNDDCDPANGGADCGGICLIPGCGEDADCREGEFCDLAAVLCLVGTECGTCQPSPKPEFCGGIDAVPCLLGQDCVDDPSDDCDPNNGGADCGGICQPSPNLEFCGGFGNLPCPEFRQCIDDPNDDCDPENGGADCGGICVPLIQPLDPTPCGGDTGLSCNVGEVCVYDEGECSGFCLPDPCSAHVDECACEADVENHCAVVDCAPEADCSFTCQQQIDS